MKQVSIDINADLGEGIGNENELMPVISSCNIACGGHAGDERSMRAAVKLAKHYRVKIGAHPSFPDVTNFGRKIIEMSRTELHATLKEQINTLNKIVEEEKAVLHHVKPHGALYNLAMTDSQTATVIIEVLKSMHPPVCIYVPYNSVIANVALAHDIPIIYEAFADRNYNDDLTLVSRVNTNALLHEENEVFQHVYRMIAQEEVKTVSGKLIPIKANTFCIHGDNPRAIKIANKLKYQLELKGVVIQ